MAQLSGSHHICTARTSRLRFFYCSSEHGGQQFTDDAADGHDMEYISSDKHVQDIMLLDASSFTHTFPITCI